MKKLILISMLFMGCQSKEDEYRQIHEDEMREINAQFRRDSIHNVLVWKLEAAGYDSAYANNFVDSIEKIKP